MDEPHGGHSATRLTVACTAVALWLALAAASPGRADLPLDEAGWSVLAPSADSRLLYVSSATGNDTTGATYLPDDPLIGPDPFDPAGAIQPFATYAAAYARTRDGYPDWVLFRRGDTWTTGLSGCRNGRSDAERMVISSYGDATTRPLFLTGTGAGLSIHSGSGGRRWAQYIAIVGLHFYCQGRNPASPDFAGYANGPSGINLLGQSSNGYVGSIRDFLVEDCHLEWYGGNLTVQAGGTSVAQNIAVRRNVLNNAYNTSAHAQGFFSFNTGPVLLEENVFDHNGWYFTGDSMQGGATIFNHNTYFSATHDVTFRGNMFLRASSIGTKWCSNNGEHTANIVLDDNLYVEGEIGMQIGGNGTDPYGFSNITVTNNVLQSIGRARPTGRTLGWGMWVWDWDGGTIERNLFIHQDTPAVSNVYAISVEGVSNRNVRILDNRVYGLFSNGQLLALKDGTPYQGIEIAGNTVDAGTYNTQLVRAAGSLANYTLANNRYCTTRAASQWFREGSANRSFAQWAAAAGEAGSTTGTLPYIDPARTVETYNAAQGGPGTFDDFIAQAKRQSRANWRAAYTATAVNAYLREGYATNRPPAFQADALTAPGATVGSPYAASVAPLASDLDTSDTLAFSKTSGPGWLQMAADGALTGTPTVSDIGPNSFAVRATDPQGLYDEATLLIAVSQGRNQPSSLLVR